MARVLILRERRAARETAAALAAAGHTPLILSLEDYRTLDLSAHGHEEDAATAGRKKREEASFSGYLLTSPRAAPALAAFVADRSRPVFAVGDRTAQAARQAGLAHVLTADGDAAALARAVAEEGLAPGSRLLYAAGRTRTGTLETALAGLDIELVVREAYATIRLDPERHQVEAVLSAGAPDAILLLSAGQGGAFCRLADRMPDRFEPKPLLVALSSRIASTLTLPWRERLAISRDPTMISLFERLG